MVAQAIEKREWAKLYSLYPEEYREKCPFTDFAGMMIFGVMFLGLSDGMSVTVRSTRIDGDEAYVDYRWEQDGVELTLGEDTGEPAFVWTDGVWVSYVSPEDLAEENPCSLDS